MSRTRLRDFIDALQTAQTEEELSPLLQEATEILGGSHFLFCSGTLAHDSERYFNTMFKEKPLCYDNYPEEWSSTYLTENLVQHDITVHKSLRSVTPVLWHKDAENPDANIRNFFGIADDHKIRSGLTLPIHGNNKKYGFWSIALDSASKETTDHIEDISFDAQVLAQHFLAAVERLQSAKDHLAAQHHLTARERETLMWTASGKTIWEISQILRISERTAKQHMLNSMRKLNAATKYQAVAKAVAGGMIDLV